MKRLLIALAGYAVYRWLTKRPAEPEAVDIAGSLPPPRRRSASVRKPTVPG